MIYIWVRATVDWPDETAFLAQLPPAFKPKVDIWNETFDIPFHLFRHELRRIAEQNLALVEGAAVARWEEIPDGALVVPVDDDDWFAPNLARVLEERSDLAATGYFWVESFLEVPINFGHRLANIRRAIFPSTPPYWLCSTNNYALVKHPHARTLLASHVNASEWFGGPGREQVRRIEGRLSMMNRSLASQTSLGFGRPSIRRSELVRKLRRYGSLYSKPLPPDLEWCGTYLAMMKDLTARLQVRDRAPVAARIP